MLLWIILVIIIILGILLLMHERREYFATESKPIIWSYWENKPGVQRPEYINLCFDTFYKHNAGFDIRILNEKTVYDYLPNLRKDINQLSLAHKCDYVRILLLHNYGGIWLDADTIVMRNLMPIINKLNEGYDYIGFGCSYQTCNDKVTGFPKPSNGVMAARKGSILLKNVLDKSNKFIDDKKNKKFGYFDMGKHLIWDSIKELQKESGYKYYHYGPSVDGTRDKNGYWVNVDNHISKQSTELLNENNLFFVFLENNKFMGKNPKYNWFSKLSKQEVLNGPWWISQLFRKSLQC